MAGLVHIGHGIGGARAIGKAEEGGALRHIRDVAAGGLRPRAAGAMAMSASSTCRCMVEPVVTVILAWDQVWLPTSNSGSAMICEARSGLLTAHLPPARTWLGRSGRADNPPARRHSRNLAGGLAQVEGEGDHLHARRQVTPPDGTASAPATGRTGGRRRSASVLPLECGGWTFSLARHGLDGRRRIAAGAATAAPAARQREGRGEREERDGARNTTQSAEARPDVCTPRPWRQG